jgi:hypothetical protein
LLRAPISVRIITHESMTIELFASQSTLVVEWGLAGWLGRGSVRIRTAVSTSSVQGTMHDGDDRADALRRVLCTRASMKL